MSLANIRREYLGEPLSEAHSDSNPMRQFAHWFEQVRHTEPDPTAMALATASPDGRPSVRTVLLNSAERHASAGLAQVASGDYAGEHWLASFAIYLLTPDTP